MNDISSILRLVPLAKSRAGSERAVIIEDFVTGLQSKYKPAYIAYRLSHIKKLEDLYWFYKKCYGSDNFAKMFFGCLKVK